MNISTRVEKNDVEILCAITCAAANIDEFSDWNERVSLLAAGYIWSFAKDSGDFIIATIDGMPAGFCLTTFKGRNLSVRIHYLYVYPGCRRKGVARALVEHCQGAHRNLVLACEPSLKGMYQKMGFGFWREAKDGSGDMVGSMTKKGFRQNFCTVTPSFEVVEWSIGVDRAMAKARAASPPPVEEDVYF